jgi:hypothetical protein
MSDSSEKGCFLKSIEGSPFFTFAKPYLDFIGKGTMFSIVYILGAVISLLFPIAVIVLAIQSGMLQWIGATGVIWFILTWLCVCFAGWIGFQLWWNRKSQITDVKESEFVAIPICADIARTFGEWIGTFLAVIGFGGGLFALIFFRDGLNILGNYGIPGGPALVLVGPIAGFFIILFFRLIAEGIKLCVSIANSLKDMSKK